MLQWTNRDHVAGTQTAVGLLGVYSVQRIGPEWLLQGVGHDGMNLLQIPPSGKWFASIDSARTWANELDRTKPVEWQISGA
ncbi:hypothetical protein KD930_gp53 [Mycobacterium phage Kevin1]|uniref:Uncharacterized protein n=1 Tax=Mycobacterium phage Kevin1 TaxID=2530132 RepID=A0A481VUN4_9CAUD|nr:hypothetical protein KD930_gp53 [Mycobacterium phage Kevin1]QBI97297.1 hypothetical protein SEA_KEVIN1_53 [Mycobacterium phage Kevin1]